MKTKTQFLIIFYALIAPAIFYSCSNQDGTPNKLSSTEKKEGWTLLFDGKTLDNWHVYNQGKQSSEWRVVNGEILCDPASPDRSGDLTSDKEYENYELVFDWKLSENGNSGVFINVCEVDTINAAWFTGPEYQLLEDTHPDYKIPSKRSGCLYGFSPQKNEVNITGANQWNHSKIVQNNGLVKFYLNNVQTAEMDFNSNEWRNLIANSGFVKFPEFGKRTKGKIVFQNWASGVSFRNIKIKER